MNKCWSCHKDVPYKAKKCMHCEADLTVADSTPDSQEIRKVASDVLDEKDIKQLNDIMKSCSTGEEFVNAVMVGGCPACGSKDTGDCENDPQVKDICVGRCFTCGQRWCLDCDANFQKDQILCKHYSICDECENQDKEGLCDIPPLDCDKLKAAMNN